MSGAVIEQRERWERRDRAAEVARSLVGESRVLVEFPSYRHGRPIRLIVRAGDGRNKQFAQFIKPERRDDIGMARHIEKYLAAPRQACRDAVALLLAVARKMGDRSGGYHSPTTRYMKGHAVQDVVHPVSGPPRWRLPPAEATEAAERG